MVERPLRLHSQLTLKAIETLRFSPPLPYLGTTRTDAGAAIPLQLEDVVGDSGCDLVHCNYIMQYSISGGTT